MPATTIRSPVDGEESDHEIDESVAGIGDPGEIELPS
jgi:hypothetical protein